MTISKQKCLEHGIAYQIGPKYCTATTVFSVQRFDVPQRLCASQEPLKVYYHVETCSSAIDKITSLT